jgi:hypothetical protein
MITERIPNLFKQSFEKEWYQTYWAFDVHGTIFVPNRRKDPSPPIFYPFAKETLKLLSERPDIVLILFTSSYPEQIGYYQGIFKENGIHFSYVNSNPEIDSSKGNFGYYKDKFYFDVLFEDKAGFIPERYWKEIYELLLTYEQIGYLPNPDWSFKY